MTHPHELADLLPCPFCGGEAKCNGLPSGILGQIYCSNDDCFGPRTTALGKEDSAAQWNTRSALAATPARPAPTNSRYSTERLEMQLMDTYNVNGDQVFYQASKRLEEQRIALASATPAVGGELQDIADEIEQSDGIALMLTGCSKQLGIRRTAMVVAALRAQPASSAVGGEATAYDGCYPQSDYPSTLTAAKPASPLPAGGGEAQAEMLDLANEFEGEAKAHIAMGDKTESTKCQRAAYALRHLAALPASPLRGREPLAWMRTWPNGDTTFTRFEPQDIEGHSTTPLYSAAPPEQPLREAIDKLTSRREKCDVNNVTVKVSREALDHVLAVVAAPVTGRPASFMEAMNIVQRGFDTWKEKPHNAKWYSRIDGTPIPNDLMVNIAESISHSDLVSPTAQENKA